MKLKNLKPAPYNPRTITNDQLDRLKKALYEFGDLSGIVFNKQTGNVVGGHQRIKCLPEDTPISKTKSKKPSRTGTVATGVITIDGEDYSYREVDWPERKEKAANLAANKHGGGFNEELLAPLLKELVADENFDMNLTGFDSSEIDGLIDSITEEYDEGDDDVPPVPEEPVTQTGDLYIMGGHRLLCGDSTKSEDIEKLMDGKKADMVFTDPPYNVNYEGAAGKIQNDNMEDNLFYQFLHDSFLNCYTALVSGGGIYIAHADMEGLNFRKAFKDVGFKLSSCLIWRKNSLVMGRSDYHWQHEPILYGWKQPGSHKFYGGRKKTTMQELMISDIFIQTGESEYQLRLGETTHVISGTDLQVAELLSTIILEEKPLKNDLHPTMKPVALIVRFIFNSSKRGQVILDSFLGSGSTLIACEKTNRICYGIELDPNYCDVIVKRWEDYTGKKAERITA